MDGNPFFSLDHPLESMPVARQMRPANLHGLTHLMRAHNEDPLQILERHGVDRRALTDPDHYIDAKSLVELFEYCSRRFNDSLFGLRLAQRQEADVYGTVAELCRAAPRFREAVHSFVDYIPVVHSPITVLELHEGRETAELRWAVSTALGQNDQANLQALALDLKLLRSVLGPAFRPLYVSLAGDTRARDVSIIETALDCRFRRGGAINAIAFPAPLLQHRVRHSNPVLFRLLRSYLERVRIGRRPCLRQRVETFVESTLPSAGPCSVEHCARVLGLSVRRLQSLLAEDGSSFSDLLEQGRIALAQRYLSDSNRRLIDVAASLGYAEQSSFSRAFKRWTGVSPQHYRQRPEPQG